MEKFSCVRNNSILYALLVVFYLCFSFCGFANKPIESCLCEPYFVCIKAKEANLHVGPGNEYKVILKFNVRFIPVVVTAKYDHWRRIKDPDGIEGWLHKNLLSTKRFVISRDEISKIYKKSNSESEILVEVKKNVIMKLNAVRGDWCSIEFENRGNKYKGWIKKDSVFGVGKNENWG